MLLPKSQLLFVMWTIIPLKPPFPSRLTNARGVPLKLLATLLRQRTPLLPIYRFTLPRNLRTWRLQLRVTTNFRK